MIGSHLCTCDRFTPAIGAHLCTCDRGAGIWVNVGRTWAVATKPELYLPWSEGDLVGRWLSKFGLPQRRLVEDRDFELSVSICRAHAAAEALKTARGGALKTDRCEAEWLLRRRPLHTHTHSLTHSLTHSHIAAPACEQLLASLLAPCRLASGHRGGGSVGRLLSVLKAG